MGWLLLRFGAFLSMFLVLNVIPELSSTLLLLAHILVRSVAPIYHRPQSRARRLPYTVGKERGIYRE